MDDRFVRVLLYFTEVSRYLNESTVHIDEHLSSSQLISELKM